MVKQLLIKLKEAVLSILPVTLLILVFSFTPLCPLTMYQRGILLFSALILVLGMGLFSLGADLAMQPMGEHTGSSLTRTSKLALMIVVYFAFGLLITIAEPDLSVLSKQVSEVVSPMTLVVIVGAGVGIFLVLGVVKIIFKKELSSMIMFFYLCIFALTAILTVRGNVSFLALAFDSGGVTTGPITVPFMMALGVGIAVTIGGRSSSENSFGLVALCSIGPVLALLILGISFDGTISYQLPNYQIPDNFARSFFGEMPNTMKEVGLSLSLIFAVFMIIQFLLIHLPKKKLVNILIGLIYTFLGLVLFLTAVNVGFMPIGFAVGSAIAAQDTYAIILFAFVLGLVVVLAEPAIQVLTKQVDDLTNGGISKKSLLISLSIGVACSICLSIIRVIFDFSILYYLVPGYLLTFALSFFIPKIYTAIAFDSGGVASGPLTSSFILPFAIGVCNALYPNSGDKILMNAFGVVSMVAMTPLISIQLLGFREIMSKKLTKKIRMRRITASDDEQIIEF